MGWLVLLLGIAVGIAGVKVYDLKINSDLTLKWWHYLLSAVLISWVTSGTIFAYNSFQEGEPRAGWFFVLLHWGLAVLAALLVIGFERRKSLKAV